MEKKQKTIEEAYSKAFKYEVERGSCPQCVLAALNEMIDVGSPDTIQAADSLAGGTALSSEGTCGALVGGLLAIGSLIGRDYEDFSKGENKRRVFQYAKKLHDLFIEEYGSILCKDVQKKLFGRSYVLFEPEDYQKFEKAGAHIDKCPHVAGNVAKWTAELIMKDLKK